MRRRFAVLITGLAICKPSRQHNRDRPTDRQGSLPRRLHQRRLRLRHHPAQDSGDVSGNFVFNQRGSSPFPYYRESVHGTVVTTNLNTGGTFTNISHIDNSKDHTIVDNGDGTITITVIATGGSRFYDTNGKLRSRTPARPGSPSTSTTTALPVTPATTSTSPTRSGSCAHPPGTATSRTATSVRTWWSSPARAKPTHCQRRLGQRG